jgi:hypothetical protein
VAISARGLVALLVSVAAAIATPAHADGQPLAGSWSAGPLNEIVTVTSWPDDCGPKPRSGGSPSGSYRVTQSGDELIFTGSPSFRTDNCWDSGSGRRVSHSATPSTRYWRTRCESAPGDARKATITTVVRATSDDTIVLSESAKYELSPKSGVTCSADVDRTRTFKLVSRDAPTTPDPATTATATATTAAPTTTAPTATATATATKPPPAAIDCSSPGDAASLDVRPKKKLLRAGDAFDVRARVIDAKGCDVGAKPSFRLDGAPKGLSVDAAGHVAAAADAEPATAGVIVEGAGKSARVELEVVSVAAYAELLGKGGIDQSGADEGAVAVTASSSGVSGSGGSVAPPEVAQSRKGAAVLTITGGVLLLAAVGFVVLRRRRDHEANQADAEVAAALERKRQRKEAVEKQRAAAEAAAKAAAAAKAQKRAQPAPGPKVALPPAKAAVGKQTMIAMSGPAVLAAAGLAPPSDVVCPRCGQPVPRGADFCPNDGTRLKGPEAPAPAAAAVASPPAASASVCPTCGLRYEGEARFCSRDGSTLIPAR